jgi:hypothetical protein
MTTSTQTSSRVRSTMGAPATPTATTYFFVLTVQTPTGRFGTHVGTIEWVPGMTREAVYNSLVTQFREKAGVPADTPLMVPFFMCEPNSLAA